MSDKFDLYLNLLQKLRADIKVIESKKSKKRWKPYQKSMIDFINGATKKVVFEKDNKKIVLAKGDIKKGFIHILLRHYKKNDLEAMDIINIFEIYDRGIKLSNNGVSNTHLEVYMKLSKGKDLRLILNPIKNNSWIITAYKKN